MKTISRPKNINLQLAFLSHGLGRYLYENFLLAPSSDQCAHNVTLPKKPSMCFSSQEGRDQVLQQARAWGILKSSLPLVLLHSVFGYQAQLLEGMTSPRARPAQNKFSVAQTMYISPKAQHEVTTKEAFKAFLQHGISKSFLSEKMLNLTQSFQTFLFWKVRALLKIARGTVLTTN